MAAQRAAAAAAKQQGNILERPIRRGAGEVSLSAFAYLLSEIVSYSQSRVKSVPNLESRLSDVGYPVGVRLLELISWRDKPGKREVKIVGILSLISKELWKALFGKQADSLEKSIVDGREVYMIIENETLITKFISVPRDFGNLNIAAFVAGIVHGILDAADFPPESVTAFSTPGAVPTQPRTVIMIKFTPAVMGRDH